MRGSGGAEHVPAKQGPDRCVPEGLYTGRSTWDRQVAETGGRAEVGGRRMEAEGRRMGGSGREGFRVCLVFGIPSAGLLSPVWLFLISQVPVFQQEILAGMLGLQCTHSNMTFQM